MAVVFAVSIVVVTLTTSVIGDSGFDGNCMKNFDNCTGNTFCGAPGNSGSPNAQYKCYYCDCANTTQCYFVEGTTIGCNCTGFGTTGEYCETQIDNCDPYPCQNDATCIDGIDFFTCICAAGFTGTLCETNIDECASNPCSPHGECIDGINSYTCICDPGWEGTNCNDDINECTTGTSCPSGYMCTNHPGGFCCN